MAGWNLRNGELKNTILTEDDYWALFNGFFSGSSLKRNSYKFGFLKSILDNLFNAEKKNDLYYLSYNSLFAKFTENYWNLILKYHLKQMRKGSLATTSAIEIILSESSKKSPVLVEIEFESVPNKEKDEIIKKVEKECKKNVVGALYKDFDGCFYSFDLKGNGIFLSEQAYRFVLKYKPELEKLNYYHWAKFLEQINDDNAIVRIIDKLELSTPRRNDLSVYRELLYKEYEERNCFYCGKKLGKNAHVDHFIPWAFTKDDKIWNFVLVCPNCNSKKNNKLANKTYIRKLENRNLKLIEDKYMEKDFSSYREDLLDEMWNYAKKSGYKEWNNEPSNKTIEYYNREASDYFNNTVNASMDDCYIRFMNYLQLNSYILDAGCGSGRDSKYFISKGYRVKAIDGSEEMCRLATNYINQEVECVSFENLDYHDKFDAVWACASLLHVNKSSINDVVQRFHNSLKQNGIMYASFKYGDSERIQGERYFADYNEDSIKLLFGKFTINELWISNDVRPGRNEKWINIIVQK